MPIWIQLDFDSKSSELNGESYEKALQKNRTEERETVPGGLRINQIKSRSNRRESVVRVHATHMHTLTPAEKN